VITDHKFRPNLSEHGGRNRQKCAWRGTCGLLKSEHVSAVRTQGERRLGVPKSRLSRSDQSAIVVE
jgi:hypothetical protein